MSYRPSVPKPWSSASSSGRTWAPIQAPVPCTPGPGPAPAVASLPATERTTTAHMESSIHDSSQSVKPKSVEQQQQAEPNEVLRQTQGSNQLSPNFDDLDSILGKERYNSHPFTKVDFR